jgi:hypothetical protein
MTTDLRERLHALADDAPRGGLAAADVWHSGVRRQRLRRAAVLGSVVGAVALVAGLTTGLPTTQEPAPAEQPAVRGIPRVVQEPDPWSEPTDRPGPLAAVSAALHRTPDGITGSRERLELYGVSAVDGVSRFLDLPSRPVDVDPGGIALSPDGTLLAVTHHTEGERVAVRGWDLLDTTTGEVTQLRVPGMTDLRGGGTYEIAFSGDGRHLLTHFSLAGSDASRAGSLVAWDVETGSSTVAEPSGHHWLPGPATSPSGVAWNRQRSVFTLDPDRGVVEQVTLPQQLIEASWAPDGETLLYVAHDGETAPATGRWRLWVTPAGAVEPREIELPSQPGQILGWRDPTHAVVSHYGPRKARLVDVESGTWEPLGLSGSSTMTPRYASDLWALPVADPVDQPAAGDPRPWMNPEVQWIAVGLLLGGALQVWLVVRRRRARR